jgi:hypothetical protein
VARSGALSGKDRGDFVLGEKLHLGSFVARTRVPIQNAALENDFECMKDLERVPAVGIITPITLKL